MAVDDSYTKALLHMNGVNLEQTFTDESGKTWTARGSSYTDTSVKKFGTASAYFDAVGDWIDTPDHADFDIGAGDFTIDMWIRPDGINQTAFLCGQADASATSRCVDIVILPDESVSGRIYVGATEYTATLAAGSYADATWLHIALVRYGNTLKIYGNGVVGAVTDDVTGVTATNSATIFSVGRVGAYASNLYKGFVDEFRFSKGIARWTANFEVPTAEYRPGGGLMLFSS